MYLARFEDRRGDTIHEEPFESFDNALAFIRENPQFRLKHTVRSALLKGAINPNNKRWKTARLLDMQADGSHVEVYKVQQ